MQRPHSRRRAGPKALAQKKTEPEQDVAAPLAEILVDVMAAQTPSGTVNESVPASKVPFARPIQPKGPTQLPFAPSFPDAVAPPPKKLAKLFLAKPPAPWPPGRLSLALQGGGSFGAFAWGVLDRMLEEPEIEFDAVSGSSAGAVNAVLLASGMIEGGREGARERLSRFWTRVSQAAALAPRSLPLGAGLDLIIRMMSPYQFNPFNVNPLREALAAEVNFPQLREQSKIKLLLGATRVRDGTLRILTNKDLTVDAVLASACLPLFSITPSSSTESHIGTEATPQIRRSCRWYAPRSRCTF